MVGQRQALRALVSQSEGWGHRGRLGGRGDDHTTGARRRQWRGLCSSPSLLAITVERMAWGGDGGGGCVGAEALRGEPESITRGESGRGLGLGCRGADAGGGGTVKHYGHLYWVLAEE
jgi:hypothetical protein